MPDLPDVLEGFLTARGAVPSLDDALEEAKAALDALVVRGVVGLGPDHRLGGQALEIRVRQLLLEVGLEVTPGRAGLEDFVVGPPAGVPAQIPLVLEVKSSRKPQISRDDLRQLDDWVFDLSQEEAARKHGMGGGLDPLALVTNGMASRRHHHPSPHKGVLVVNAPLGTQFRERVGSCLAANDAEFVEKRNFCVIPLPVLLDYVEAQQSDKMLLSDFWELVHGTCGALHSPA